MSAALHIERLVLQLCLHSEANGYCEARRERDSRLQEQHGEGANEPNESQKGRSLFQNQQSAQVEYLPFLNIIVNDQ